MYQEEKEVSKQLAGISVSKIKEAIKKEISKVIHHDLTQKQLDRLHEFADHFAEVIRGEMWRALSLVIRAGQLKRQFKEKMVKKLETAAAKIAEGLDMTEEQFEQFFENILRDFTKFDVGGVFHLDLDEVFGGIIDVARSIVHHRHRRDLGDIIDQLNNTIVGILGHTHGINQHVGDIFELIFNAAFHAIKPHLDQIKTLAKNFLENIGDSRSDVLHKALELFKPFASVLGDVWTRISQLAKERLDKLAKEKTE